MAYFKLFPQPGRRDENHKKKELRIAGFRAENRNIDPQYPIRRATIQPRLSFIMLVTPQFNDGRGGGGGDNPELTQLQ